MAKGIWAFEDADTPPAQPEIDTNPENGKPEGELETPPVTGNVDEGDIGVPENELELDSDDTNLDVEIEGAIVDSLEATYVTIQETEGIEIGEVLEKIEEAPTVEEKLEIATEHLLKSVGLKDSKISLEDYHTKLNKNLQLSQEGFLGRIGNGLKRTFTSRKKLSNKLEAALTKLKTNGVREDDIKDPSWSKSLIANSSSRVTPANVVNYYNKLNGIVTSKEVNEFFKRAGEVLQKTATELDKGRFLASDVGAENIIALNSEIDEIVNKVDAFLNSAVKKNLDKYPDYVPIDYQTAKGIATQLNDKIIDSNSTAMKNYFSIVNKYNDNFFNNAFMRLAGNHAKDVKAARKVVTTINESATKIYHLVNLLNKSTYSLVRYIEDSSK